MRFLPGVSIFQVSTHQVPGVHPSGSGSPSIRFRVSIHQVPGMLWSGAASSRRKYIPGVHPSGSGCSPIHPSCCPTIGRGEPGCPPTVRGEVDARQGYAVVGCGFFPA